MALDGITPFSIQSFHYTIWPIIVVNYNIPPWMTMKKEHLMLTVIVPGRRKVKNVDVFLELVIDELMQLGMEFKIWLT